MAGPGGAPVAPPGGRAGAQAGKRRPGGRAALEVPDGRRQQRGRRPGTRWVGQAGGKPRAAELRAARFPPPGPLDHPSEQVLHSAAVPVARSADQARAKASAGASWPARRGRTAASACFGYGPAARPCEGCGCSVHHVGPVVGAEHLEIRERVEQSGRRGAAARDNLQPLAGRLWVGVLVQPSGAGARLDVKVSRPRKPFGIKSQSWPISRLASPPRLAGTGGGTSSYVEAGAQYDGLGPLVR